MNGVYSEFAEEGLNNKKRLSSSVRGLRSHSGDTDGYKTMNIIGKTMQNLSG